jgi:hypothetical protein
VGNNRLKTAVLAVMILVLIPAQTSLAAKKTAAKQSLSCDQKLALVNYRSDILMNYKRRENSRYNTARAQWANRISYASQWIPKDATKARTKLYKYDALHKATDQELDRQIATYRSLSTHPLDCTAAHQAELARRIADIHGLQGKKAVSGNALIAQKKKQETKFYKGDLRKTNASLVKKLHKAKHKHPKPKHGKIDVKPVLQF